MAWGRANWATETSLGVACAPSELPNSSLANPLTGSGSHQFFITQRGAGALSAALKLASV